MSYRPPRLCGSCKHTTLTRGVVCLQAPRARQDTQDVKIQAHLCLQHSPAGRAAACQRTHNSLTVWLSRSCRAHRQPVLLSW